MVARSTPRRNSCKQLLEATSHTRNIVPLVDAVANLLPSAVKANSRNIPSCTSCPPQTGNGGPFDAATKFSPTHVEVARQHTSRWRHPIPATRFPGRTSWPWLRSDCVWIHDMLGCYYKWTTSSKQIKNISAL